MFNEKIIFLQLIYSSQINHFFFKSHTDTPHRTTPQIHTENNTKKKEPKTLQPKVLVSTDRPLNISLYLQNHSQNNKKKGGFEVLDDSITTMKAELLEVKKFFYG